MAVSSPEGWDRFNRFIPERRAIEREIDWLEIPREQSLDLLGEALEAPSGGAGGGVAIALDRPHASPLQTARALLQFGLGIRAERGDRMFRVASQAGSRSGRTLALQQQAEGVDVVGATVKVHFGRSGDFVVTGRALANLGVRSPRASVRTTPAAAAKAAAGAFDLPTSSVHATELQCFPVADDEARWVWRVSLLAEEPVADVRAYLDADTLKLDLSYNIASALTGRAGVFPRNPNFPPAIEAGLIDLGPTPTDQLVGRRLIVRPNRLPPLARANRDFRVSQADMEFDEPNAYYHLREGLRYFATLKGRRRRFDSPPFRPLTAVVRHRPSRNNAFYVPDTGQLLFGSFDVGSAALSADILYHELAHAVSDNASKLSRGLAGSESRGLSEGYSDYFADSVLDDPWMCDWVAPKQARNAADSALRFAPGFVGSEHDTGAVWSAVLWGIRDKVHKVIADQIAYDSLYLVGPNSTFADGRRALQIANKELFAAGKIAQDCSVVIDQEWAKRI